MEAQFLSLEGDFVVRQGTELIEYHRISDIPDKFDHLIKFMPKYQEPPHDINDHALMENMVNFLTMLQAREQKWVYQYHPM